MTISVIDRMGNIVGKGENAGYVHFLLFLQILKNASSETLLKLCAVWKRVNSLPNDKILDWSKLKAFADGKINGT